MTREAWLMRLTVQLRPLFEEAGHPLPPKIRVSCGWPTHRALAPNGKSRTVGQCWPTECSADGRREVFVSPFLSDASQVAAVLVHELCHAVLDCEHGHRAPFKRVATALGLTGKMTATVAGEKLTERLNALLKDLPPYPHAALDRTASPEKKQGTRLVKVECPECGYTIRVTRKWLDIGVPTCVCGTEMVAPGAEEEGE